MEPEIRIRPYEDNDAEDFAKIHHDAVHNAASQYYPDDILKEWSPEIDSARLEKIRKSAESEIRVMAEIGKKVVGFGCLVPESNELRACYVSIKYHRRGIGKRIVERLEKIARGKGVLFLQTYSSINAKEFYESCGYCVIEKGVHTLSSGKKMDCFVMKKDL